MQADLYQAILARRSVRRYDQNALDDDALARVRELATHVQPLEPGNRFEARLQSTAPGQDLVLDLGGYGRVVNPPHFLVPYIVGEAFPYSDLGCRVEQIAVRLAAMDLGSCFIGCVGREEGVRARFGLPPEARVVALLAFGRPSDTLGGRAVNALMRAGVRATDKLPLQRLFYVETLEQPSAPPAGLAPLLEAARQAPSAVNAQPWRFLWQDGQLHLFVKRRSIGYGTTLPMRYSLHDGGACMGNVLLAMEALGIAGHWAPYGQDGLDAPPHPEMLLPLAHLILE
ncbi:MAG TPA: nitroreductase family protein [Anaerolineae bacterium]|nr:nitroreductase family protein [Anaerolineae bacterium]HPL27738.1 nitroreductase family protein [Anaerolineae bacterium]